LSHVDAKVAYNLRYLNALQWLKSDLEGQRVLRVSSRAHSYLPDWREDSGSRVFYSQKLEQGGGALNDLAHEFDYLGYLLNGWTLLASVGGRLGGVTLDADDSWFVLGESGQRAHVSVSLSILSRLQVRDLTVDTERDSFFINLRTGTYTKNEESRVGNQIGDTYELMHHEFVYGSNFLLPSFEENQATLNLISGVRSFAILQNQERQ
jgi:predicted dehydrogenase